MKKHVRSFLFLIGLSLLPMIGFSQWSTNPAVNNAICVLSGEQAIPKIATCPNGDTYIGYYSNESGNYNVRLQRLDATGNILWAPNGILISDHPQETWLTDWDMTCDASGYAILTFNDIRTGNWNIIAYRISPSGSFIWGANGILLSNDALFNTAPKVVVTSAGNTVVAWMANDDIRMQKILPSGALQWGANGITLSSENRLMWPQMIPVGNDEFIMKYFDDIGSTTYPTRNVFAQRYSSSGTGVWSTPASVSTAGGITAWTQIFPFINDGSDGFYIAWHDDRDNNQRASIFVQHVNSSGVPQYTTNGVEVSAASAMNHYYPKLALPTGSTDVYVYWNEMNALQTQWGIFGQKINSSGITQWGSNGMTFIPVSATNVYPYEARKSPTDMILVYEEYANAINGQIKAMRISPSGTLMWSPGQKTICSVSSEKVHPVVNEFANNQWIVSWEDNRSSNFDIYAQNIQLNGDLGPSVPGTISGIITLSGGSGNVTEVIVQAGTTTTNPDATGHYSLNVLPGNYAVNASLTGYTPASQSNVVVLPNQTTTVNLTLNYIPVGYIEGNVILVGGIGAITSVQVSAGAQVTSPNAAGNYSLPITPGTYDVIANLAAYIPDTVFNVTIADGQTVTGINFSLSLAPTNGLITGTVTLTGGTGNVTQVVVSAAGAITTYPDASGFYTLNLLAGNYDISASLSGYVTQWLFSVPVLVNQTTPNVNFNLSPVANSGNILGHVTITGEPADVTLTDITANGTTTHPDAAGNYNMSLQAGAYDVTATHPYTNSQTIDAVTVVGGQTTSGVDFTLNVNRADMIVSAINHQGLPLNAVVVVIEGPEGPYTGTITNDSLVFPHVPYGTYDGEATWAAYAPVLADTVIDASNHDLIFDFVITGINEHEFANGLQVNPNPAKSWSQICFSLPVSGRYSLDVLDARGQQVASLSQNMGAGNHRIPISDITGSNSLVQGVYCIRLTSDQDLAVTCKFLYLGN